MMKVQDILADKGYRNMIIVILLLFKGRAS